MKSIDEIRKISKINNLKNEKKLKKFREKLDRREKKRANKLIMKLDKLILKCAKRGMYRLCYEKQMRNLLTSDSKRLITQYFSERGYKINVETYVMYRGPNCITVDVNWRGIK